MSKHWKRFAAVVVSLTMAFQFCVNDFYAYAETNAPEQETVVTNTEQPQTPTEPEVTTEPVGTQVSTEPAEEPAPEVETETTTPPVQEQPQQPAQEETPAQPERESAGTLKLEFKDEEGNTLKTVDPIALTNKYVGDTIRLTDLGVDTNVAGYTLVDIKDKNDSTKDYNPNSVDFTLTKNITELQLVYRANPKEPETTPTENDTNTTEDSQQGEGEEDSEADADEADTEEEDSEEPAEEEEKTTQKQKNMLLSVLLADITRSDNIPITMSGDDGNWQTGIFGGGAINAKTVPNWDGYTFTNATVTVNGTAYEIAYLVEYDGSYYYARESDVNVATKLDSINDVVFHYEKNVTHYDITYNVTGASSVEGNSYEGVAEVKEGSDLSFSVNTAIGYDAEVTVDGKTPTVKEENYGLTKVYTVTNIQKDVTVNINFKELTEFNIDLSWKNNQLDLDNGHLHAGDITSNPSSSFEKGDTVTWTIESYDDTWMLNGLSINGENINIPTDFSAGASSTTVLTQGKNAGIVVTVTCNGIQEEGHWESGFWPWEEDEWKIDRSYYTHTVTIKNAQTDLELTYANLRAEKHKEVMPLEITGVTLYAETTSGETELETATPQAQSIFRDPMGFTFTLNPGYSNPVVKVNGQTITPRKQGDGSYTFSVHKDRNVVTVSVVATKTEYQVKYDLKGGSNSDDFIDNNSYNIDQPTILVNSNIPTKNEQYFAGWKIKGDSNGNTYQPGDTVSIEELTIDSEEIIFEAQWKDEASYGVWTKYKVVYQYQTAIGKYETDQSRTETYDGILGTTVAMFQANPTIVVNGITYYLDGSNVLVGEITEPEQEVITLKYNRKFKVEYNTNGGSFESENDYTSEEIAGDTITVIDETPVRAGYKFNGWKIDGKILKDKTFEMPFEDVTLVAQWEKDIEQWYDLKYDANGGQGGPKDEIDAYLSGETVILNQSDKPTLDKATFLGWSQTQTNLVTSKEEAEAATIITELTMPDEDTTVYAVWASDLDKDGTPDYSEEKYDLVYDVNGGQNGPVTESNAYINKQIVRLDSKTIPTKEGAIFLGWSETRITENLTAAPSEGIIVTEVTFEASDKTVYAVWAVDNNDNDKPDYSEAYSLTIYYQYAQGEEGDDDLLPETYNQSEMKVGETYNVASPEVQGYVARPTAITGTIDQSNVEETVTYYRDSNGNGEPDQEDNRYTVRFLDYDGTVLSTQSVLEGMSAVAPANPTRDGYTFTGWDRGFDNITSDLDVNAQYQANPAPVVPDDDDDDTPTTPTTPGGGEGTGTTPTTGGPVAAADDDADAEDEPEEEEVEDEETPLSDGEEDVDEGKTPLAKIDVWALINLIAAIITVLFGLILLLSKRHKNDDEEDEEERQARIERGEEKEQEQKRGWICKVLGVLVAIGSVVLFILTEDMSLPMAMTDEWTIWMIIIAVVELVLLLVGRHWKDVDDDEEEQAQA